MPDGKKIIWKGDQKAHKRSNVAKNIPQPTVGSSLHTKVHLNVVFCCFQFTKRILCVVGKASVSLIQGFF